jgi:hypothetical protein
MDKLRKIENRLFRGSCFRLAIIAILIAVAGNSSGPLFYVAMGGVIIMTPLTVNHLCWYYHIFGRLNKKLDEDTDGGEYHEAA